MLKVSKYIILKTTNKSKNKLLVGVVSNLKNICRIHPDTFLANKIKLENVHQYKTTHRMRRIVYANLGVADPFRTRNVATPQSFTIDSLSVLRTAHLFDFAEQTLAPCTAVANRCP